MAKKKKSSKPNVSAEIRKYYDSHPDVQPKDVVEALRAEGMKVTNQFVSTVRSTQLKKLAEGSTLRKVGRPKGATGKKSARSKRKSTNNAKQDISFEDLVKAKQLVDELGGIERTRIMLDALSQIVD